MGFRSMIVTWTAVLSFCACGDDASEDDAPGDDAATGVDASQATDAGDDEVARVLSQVEGDCAATQALYVYTIVVRATGLDDLEGKPVRGYTRMGLVAGGSCAARAAGRVEDGALELTMESLSDGAAYPVVALWIDSDTDGSCELDADVVYRETWTALEGAEQTLERERLADSFERETACEPFE